MAPDMVAGVFLGWDLQSGGKWRKGYLVVDLRAFKSMPFGISAPASACRVHVQSVDVVLPFEGEVFFPLRAEYERANYTIEGIRAEADKFADVGGDGPEPPIGGNGPPSATEAAPQSDETPAGQGESRGGGRTVADDPARAGGDAGEPGDLGEEDTPGASSTGNGLVLDKRGRPMNTDESGTRLRKNTPRPSHINTKVWHKMSKAEQRQARVEDSIARGFSKKVAESLVAMAAVSPNAEIPRVRGTGPDRQAGGPCASPRSYLGGWSAAAVRVSMATLGDDSGLVGAALLS
jgi:hypothetical protein